MGCALLIAMLSTINTSIVFVKELNLIVLREEFVALTLMAATEPMLVMTLKLHVKRTVLVLSGAHHYQTTLVIHISVSALTSPAPDTVVTVQWSVVVTTPVGIQSLNVDLVEIV